MDASREYVVTLNRGLREFFLRFVRTSLYRPDLALGFARTVLHQLAAERRRRRNALRGRHIPPIAIFSITDRCNLRCKGCFAQELRNTGTSELAVSDIRRIVGEADALGVSFLIIAGGEPLTRPEILDIAHDYPRVLFLLVTNGTLLTPGRMVLLRRSRNIVPVLSIEGREAETDDRRGGGTYRRVLETMARLKRRSIFFSVSITVTRDNFDTVVDFRFIEDAIRAGCGFFLYLEYTPIQPGTEGWVITEEQRERMGRLLPRLRRRFSAVFIAVPWDEHGVGGCLAAGRGFVHISPEGRLEACPLAPFSDRNLQDLSLAEALKSPLLSALREGHELFDDSAGGCTLWRERKRVERLLESMPEGSGDGTRSEARAAP